LSDAAGVVVVAASLACRLLLVAEIASLTTIIMVVEFEAKKSRRTCFLYHTGKDAGST